MSSLSRQRRRSSNKAQPGPSETGKVAGGQGQAKPDVPPVAAASLSVEEPKPRTISTGYYRCHVDQFDDSPFEIPNSQAPIPGREVFWDMDTPETKRYRQSLLALDSPLCNSPPPRRSPTPRMKLVSRRRKEVVASQDIVTAGDLAMEACLRLLAGEEEVVEGGDMATEEVVEGGDMFSDEEMEHEPAGELDGNVFEETANEDFFSADLTDEAAKDSTNVKNLDFNDCEADVFGDNDGFEDGDESLLLAASQQVNATPRGGEGGVKEEKEVEADAFKLPLVHRALERLQEEDTVIFDSDDSFDDALSQMPDPCPVMESPPAATPASPVLKKRRSPKRRSAEQLKEIFLNVTKPPPKEELVVKPKVQTAPSSFKKHSSFDQAVKVEVTGVRRENSLKRIKSSPVISQDRAGKEQIEGKRKEALVKRQEALAKRQEAEAKRQKEELDRKNYEELARKTKEELARKSQEELARKTKEEQARKTMEELARKTKEELARKTKEELARKSQEELARKTKEEQARKTKEAIERKRREALARRAASQASQQSQRPGVRN